MTTYRVGEAGATVLDSSGAVVGRIPPGYVVVEGTIETRPSDPVARIHDGKRVTGYADKRLVPAEDKSL